MARDRDHYDATLQILSPNLEEETQDLRLGHFQQLKDKHKQEAVRQWREQYCPLSVTRGRTWSFIACCYSYTLTGDPLRIRKMSMLQAMPSTTGSRGGVVPTALGF